MEGWMDGGGRDRGMDGGVRGQQEPLPPYGCPGMSTGCKPAPPSQEAESPVGPGGGVPACPHCFSCLGSKHGPSGGSSLSLH